MSPILLPPEEADVLMSRAHAALHDDLRRGWHAKSVLAVHAQARIAKAFQDLGPVHHETLGQLTMVVDPVIYEEMRREHGIDCWRDKAFRRRFAMLNPECKIESRSRHTRVAVNGLRRDGKCSLRDASTMANGQAGASACAHTSAATGGLVLP